MSPPFEEYIGKLLAVVVSLRVFTIRFILYKCPIENGDGPSYIPKLFNRAPTQLLVPRNSSLKLGRNGFQQRWVRGTCPEKNDGITMDL